MASKIDLVSNALILIGDKPINSLESNDRRAVVASNLYDSIARAELSKFYWGFARKKAQLALTTETPIDEWRSVYQMPADLLIFIKLYPNISYQIYADKIYCNVSQKLTCDYVGYVDESLWPDYFNTLIQYALAKDFSTSIRDSSTLRQEMAAEYINQSRMARATDSQQRPQTPIVSRPFIDVRH